VEIVRKELTSSEVSPPSIRYDDATDAIQVTPDGGTTWNDAPGQDPRHDDAYRVPPLGGASPACDAAANMVAMLQGFVDTVVTVLDYLALINAAAGILARFIGLIGWLVSLVLAIIDALLVIGRSAIAAAFDQAAYDTILCILANNVDAEGQVSAAALENINADILAQLGSTVSAVWGYTMTGLGEVGLSNAGALGTETGDCSDCFETCHVYDQSALAPGDDGVYTFRTYDSGIFEDEKTLRLTSVYIEYSMTCTGYYDGDWTVTLYSESNPSGVNFTQELYPNVSGNDTIIPDTDDWYRIYVRVRSAGTGGCDYPTVPVLRFEYEPVPTPFGWATGENCS